MGVIHTENEKLYSALTFYLHDPLEEERSGESAMYGIFDDRYAVSHEVAFENMDAIELAVLRDRKLFDPAGGLAEYVPEPLRDAVVSFIPDVELHGDRLWCVADIKLSRTLAPEEMADLTQWWSGQLSDGWGEGFSQHGIYVGGGELYAECWSSTDGFVLENERGFRERMGLPMLATGQPAAETPAQAALHEPDIFDDSATASLRDQLIERLNGNFKEYMSGAARNSEWDVTDMSSEIAAYAGAHYHLTELHNFHTSELEYLLLFKNPLQVVADAFMDAGSESNSDIMWHIFDQQEAIHGDYERVTEPAPAVFSGSDLVNPPPITFDMALVRQLYERVGQNFAAFEIDLLTSKRDVISIADKIAAMENARYYLTEFAHEFSSETIEGLLKLDNPLKVVAYAWEKHISDLSDMTGIIREVALKADIAKLGKDPDHADSRVMRSFYPDEKPSVLEQLRQAAKEPKPPRREPPQRGNNRPEH